MLVSELITNINDALRGTDDDAPISGSPDYSYWLRVANRLKNNLYDDTSKNWSVAFEERSIGTIAANASPSFDLDDDFLDPSDQAYVLTSDGQKHYYDIIKPQERRPYCQEVYIAGQDPQVLHFVKAILSTEAIVGGTLYLPGFWRPDDMVRAGETVPVPDANWLVMATAAKIAFNDLTYEDKYEDLLGEANYLYNKMIRKNRAGSYNNPRVTPTKVKRITGFK